MKGPGTQLEVALIPRVADVWPFLGIPLRLHRMTESFGLEKPFELLE